MSNKDVEQGGNGRTSKSYPPGYYSSHGESHEKKWISWLIPLFVVVNIAVFIVTMYVNNCPRDNSRFEGDCVAKFFGRLSFQPLKENPLFGPSTSKLYKMGGLERYTVIHEHEGWRLVSCIWLHGGVVHLLLNMTCLVFIGIRLEQQFGFVKVGVIYLLSGFGGALLSFLFLDNTITVGASGALFGLLGSMMSELLTNWTIYTNKVAAIFTLFILIAINLAVGIFPIIDNFSHIGGFLTGFLLGFVLLMRPQFGWVKPQYQSPGGRVKSKYKIYQWLLFVVALIVLIIGISAGLVMVLRGVNGNEHCSWCHYLDCVSTSKWKCDI